MASHCTSHQWEVVSGHRLWSKNNGYSNALKACYSNLLFKGVSAANCKEIYSAKVEQ